MRLILLSFFLLLILGFQPIKKMRLEVASIEQSSLVKSKSQVDRRALFSAVYQRYLLMAVHATQTLYNHLTDIEQYYATQILIIADHYINTNKVPLMFSRDQSIFQLPNGSPPRTFLIGFNLGEPIYVNLNVINDPLADISIAKVFQLLTHDFGHFIKNKDQSIVDGLAAKLQSIIEAQQLTTTTVDGAKIAIFSSSSMSLFKFNDKSVQASHLSYLQFNPLLCFIEKNGKIMDVAENLILALEARQRIDISENGRLQYFRNFYWNFDSVSSVEENDSQRTWFKLRATHMDFAGSQNITALEPTFFEDIKTSPEKLMQFHEFIVGMNDSTGKIERFYDVERITSTQLITNGTLQVVEEKNNLLRLRFQIDEARFEIKSEKDIVLLMNSSQKLIHNSVKKIGPDLFEAEVIKPKGSVSLDISSLLLKGSVQLYFKEGISVAGRGIDDSPQKSFGIKKIGFRIRDQFYPLKKEQTLPREMNDIEFLVQSSSPILEIRILESKNYGILNTEANRDFLMVPLNPEKYPHPVIRTDYKLNIYTSNQFSQTKLGNNLYQIMIPYDSELHPLLNPSPSFQEKLQKEMPKSLLQSLTQMDQLLSSYLDQSVQGNDLGVRKLHNIQVTNSNLDRIKIMPKSPFAIDLMSDFQPKVTHRANFHQCSQLFKQSYY